MSGAIKKYFNPGGDKKAELTGEQIVLEYLRNKGFNVETGDEEFEAKRDSLNFLFQVKYSLNQKNPNFVSPDEEEKLKLKAANKGYEAWEARVNLDKKYQPIGEILWRKIF